VLTLKANIGTFDFGKNVPITYDKMLMNRAYKEEVHVVIFQNAFMDK